MFSIPKDKGMDINEGQLWLGSDKGMIIRHLKVIQFGVFDDVESEKTAEDK